MTPEQEAAAMHGLAENKAYPIGQRLSCALKALAFYEREWQEARAAADVGEGEWDDSTPAARWQRIATTPGNDRILVTVWDNDPDTIEVALRPQFAEAWGPPLPILMTPEDVEPTLAGEEPDSE